MKMNNNMSKNNAYFCIKSIQEFYSRNVSPIITAIYLFLIAILGQVYAIFPDKIEQWISSRGVGGWIAAVILFSGFWINAWIMLKEINP